MSRNPQLNPRPNDVLTYTRNSGPDKGINTVTVKSVDDLEISVCHSGPRNREYVLGIGAWCKAAKKWDVVKVAEYSGPKRSPVSEPKRGDALLIEGSDPESHEQRQVLGSTKTSFSGAKKPHVEVQYCAIGKKAHPMKSCSLQQWMEWASKAIIVSLSPDDD